MVMLMFAILTFFVACLLSLCLFLVFSTVMGQYLWLPGWRSEGRFQWPSTKPAEEKTAAEDRLDQERYG